MKSLGRTKPRLANAASRLTTSGHSRRSVSSSSPKVVLGVRREDPGRLWERRCPVTPDAVHDLVREGVEVLVQPCERRVWPNEEFVQAGASLHPTLEPANIVIGIKETPINELDRLTAPVDGRERTHVMFSHTAKGQLYNMPLLSRFVGAGAKAPRLVDYELLTGADGKRVVGFGWFAGASGLVEGLTASAHDWLSLGVSSPFLYLPRPYSHPSLADMRKSLRSVGEIISTRGMPKSTGPFVIAVTGNGNVARGALDLIQELPIQYVKANDLPSLVSDPDTDLRKVYVIHVPSSAYLNNKKTGTAFDRTDYYANPQDYESHFHEKIAPFVSVLINGAGWAIGFPRILPSDALPRTIQLARQIGKTRFRTIADVSCDIGGGVEFVNRSCTIDDPFFYCDSAGQGVKQPTPDGIQVMSVDILPSEIPLDASKHFSEALKPYLGALLRTYQGKAVSEDDKVAMEVVDRATIARGGELRPKHAWLGDLIAKGTAEGSSAQSNNERADLDLGTDLGGTESGTGKASYAPPRRRVLLLGSGMVAKPAVDEFLMRRDVDLVIASNNLNEAKDLIKGRNKARVVQLDASDREAMSKLVADAHVVVSLLPAPLHPPVAELCIEHRKNLVTASYISPAMKSLDARAQSADVILLNEIGLDPGIDHCSAMDLRHRIEVEGRKIVEFQSWCGGLPAPEDSNVPLGMKFSWSPKGLLSAALNDARFKLNGYVINIPGHSLLRNHFPSVPLMKGLAVEGLANRDSLPYAETYGLGRVEDLRAVFRGTLRYPGFSHSLDILRRIGLLASDRKLVLDASQGGWYGLVAATLKSQLDTERHFHDIQGMLIARIGKEPAVEVWPLLEELSVVPPSKRRAVEDLPPLPALATPMTPLDLLTIILAHKLRYQPGERDMVLLSHEVTSVPKSSLGPALTHTSTLVTYGTPTVLGTSAMARTVGLPLAIAALKVLDGKIPERGVKGPSECGREVWRGVMDGLEERGIVMKEATKSSEFNNA